MTDVNGDPAAGEPLPDAEVDQSTETEPDTASEGDTDGEGEELEDYELEGAKFTVPKSVKDVLDKGVLRQADYTKKTMDLAENRRAYEAEKAASEATFEDRVTIRNIQANIQALDETINATHERFQNIDWAALKALPDGDMRLQQAQVELRNLENARTRLAEQQTKLTGELTEKAKTSALTQQQAVAKLIEAREATLAKEVPGWAKLRPEVEAFAAAKFGVSKAELDATPDPRVLKALRYAKLGMEAEQRGRAASSEEPETVPVKPAASLTAPSRRTVSTGSRESMKESPEAWARRRNAELAARNQRPAPRR
jgi:hypothetical protein